MSSENVSQPAHHGVPTADEVAAIKAVVRAVPDFPKPGILFRDVSTLCLDGKALRLTTRLLADYCRLHDVHVIAGCEARGFIWGATVAAELGIGFAMLRKPGKLPGATVAFAYALEYGTAALHLHEGAIQPGQRVLIIDDLLATGGTLEASGRLVEQVGGVVAACACIIELSGMGGRERLGGRGWPVHTLVSYEGDA